MPYRIIADHIRTCVFALSDGAIFSNDGRGYVLRRVIRRAMKYARKLDINKPFLYELVDTVCDMNKPYYPYLQEKKALSELEEEELIFTERTNGKYVTTDRKIIDKARKKYAKELTKEYQNKMKAIGY